MPSFVMQSHWKTAVCHLSALFFCFFVAAQPVANPRFKNISVSVQHYYGSYLTTAPKAAYVRDAYAAFTEINIIKQTNGTKPWHKRNNFPQTGAGIVYGATGSRQFIGKAISVYPFVIFPFIRSRRFQSSIKVGTGISYIQKPYNIVTNHKNTLIGSHFNNYIHLSQHNELRLTKHLFFNGGIAFTHISNGNIKLPNYGLNYVLLTTGLRYAFHQTPIKDTSSKHKFSKQSFRIAASIGAKQTPWIKSPYYFISIGSVQYVRSFSVGDAVGAGLDVFYDPSLTKDPSGFLKTSNGFKNIQTGLQAFYERKLGRLSIPLGVGVYLLHAEKGKSIYQTFGLRYELTKKLGAYYLLKTHGGKADFLHAGVSYTL